MKEIILIKNGELALKGLNRSTFEDILIKNIRKRIKPLGEFEYRKEQSTVAVVPMEDYIDMDEVSDRISRVFGIAAYSRALQVEKDMDVILKNAPEYLAEQLKNAKTFKVEGKRSDKKFPLNSYQICCESAGKVESIMKVDVHKPDVVIYVEVREKVFVYVDSNVGCRGLPVGSSGKGLLLLSGGLDSPVAGYRMLRRGMKIECCYFHSYPYTSEEAKQKVVTLAQKLAYYGITTYLNIIPFTDVQMKIKEKAPEAWSTLILRVCMMKVANILAKRCNAKCIITGESVGQVASQTIENMTVTEHFSDFPLLRPLCGMDKEEIIKDAYFIDTYETSILPYEDCCVLFSPRHPVLRGTVEQAEEIYKSLEVDDLINEAYNNREIVKLTFGEEPSIKTDLPDPNVDKD